MIALRSAMTMSPGRGGIFDTLLWLVRAGLGGTAGSGEQFVSWIHYLDFIRAIEHPIAHAEFEGPVNICAPHPLPNRDFMRILRGAWGARFGLAPSNWMLEAGAALMRTETELILKSRRVVPGRLMSGGFEFQFSEVAKSCAGLGGEYQASRTNSYTVISGGAPIRMGTPMVPMPRFT
jgi:NAD dependent epimerase/dehydratase family enzyme